MGGVIGGGVILVYAAPPYDGYKVCASQAKKCGSEEYQQCISDYCEGTFCDPEDEGCISQCYEGGMKWCS